MENPVRVICRGGRYDIVSHLINSGGSSDIQTGCLDLGFAGLFLKLPASWYYRAGVWTGRQIPRLQADPHIA